MKEIEIQESEIDNYLQQHKEMLTPKKFEERTFTMYMFPNQNYAYKGLKIIKQKRYKQVKTQLMPGVQRVSYTKTAMSSKFNSQIADAAFAIKAVNDASDVVFIDNMYCVFVLAKSQTKTLPVNRGQVRQQVKELLMQEHSEKLGYDDGKEIRNKIDDAVASGKTIEEIRDIFNLSDSYFKTIDNVQNNANSLNKLRFATLNAQEDVANVLEAIFATDKGEISQNIEINGGKAIVLISVKNIALKHSEQLNDIYKTVENDLIHDKEKQFIKNMIDSKDNVKDLRVELAKYNRSTEIAVSLFDLIMSANKQNANKNKKISDFISKGNNINILTDCVLSLNRDEWRYFDNNDGSYTVVIVSDAKPGEVSKDCSTFVNNMVMMFTNNGVPKCVSVACEKSFSIKVKQKRIDRLTEN